MTMLDQGALYAACRTIYMLSQDKLALPPLMRGLSVRQADAGETDPGHKYLIRTSAGSISFAVGLNPMRADRNFSASAHLPLTFLAELQTGETSADLTGRDRHELIRAFLLGVKMPIALEATSDAAAQRLSVQLAPRYSFDCGEVINPRADNVCGDICDVVSAALHARSPEFFADPQNGLAVWRMRAAQELFGDPRPAAETFWPFTTAATAEANPFVAPTAEASKARPPYTRYAVAAALAAALIAPASYLAGSMHRPAATPDMQGAALTPVVQTAQPVQIALPAIPEAQIAEPVSLAVLVAPPTPAVLEKADQDAPAGEADLASAPKSAPIPALPPAPLIMAMPAIMPFTHDTAPRPAARQAMAAPKKVKVAAVTPKKMARPVRRQAPNHFANPFPSAKKVAATIAGAMKGIERIPSRLSALVKAQTSAR